MKLTIKERVLVLGLYPETASYSLLKKLNEVRKDLDFTAKERQDFDINPEVEGHHVKVHFNEEASVNHKRDFSFDPEVKGHFTQVLRERDKQGLLREIEMSIFEKFVLGKEDK